MERPKSSTFFKTNKDSTNKFFKDSKVGSCSHVIVKNGVSIAVPFRVQTASYKTTDTFSSETKSTYRKAYDIKPNMHVGMAKKPLVPYNPTSYRNRLPTPTCVMPHKNKSVVELGDPGLVNRKQWRSTKSDFYQKPVTFPIGNTGILSDIAIRAHKKLNG